MANVPCVLDAPLLAAGLLTTVGAAGEDREEFRRRAAVGGFLIVRGRGLQLAGRL
ncbi:MAG: hypothetical protein NC092_05430 [Butyrivibrio sp.]|nr:hypothetical protein [Muribaculum sp.]MCM1552116.1 hypothetical protein [Butyrivibrio sp.]